MNKKILTAALAVLLTFGAGIGCTEGYPAEDSLFISASATNYINSGDYTYYLDSNEAIIDCYNGNDSNVVIPDTLDGHKVVKIDRFAFEVNSNPGSSNIVNLTIPSSVKKIYRCDQFNTCQSLENINVASGNEVFYSENGVLYERNDYYGDYARACPRKNKQTTITIPYGINQISEKAFAFCENLKTLKIPETVKKLESCAIYVDENLTNVNVPSSVESIEGFNFFECASLENISVDENNKFYSSDNGILYDKNKTELISYPTGSNLKSVVIPDTVTSLGLSGFKGSKNLERIKLSKNIEEIDGSTFENCKKLVNIEMSDDVKSIGYSAFAGCESLTEIKLPEKLESIDTFAFLNCDNMKGITIPKSVTSIDFMALGYGENGKISDFTITGYLGSAAEKYAKNGGFVFKDITQVTNKDISKCNINVTSSRVYSGAAIKSAVTVNDGTKTLKNGTDYTVSYSNNTNVGTANVTITGKGDYKGTVKKTFNITTKKLSDCTVSLTKTSYAYNGTSLKPSVTVKIGNKTISNDNYTVKYENNRRAGTATVTVTGKKNLRNSVKKTFTITKRALSACDVTLEKTSYNYTGNLIKPVVTVKVNGIVVYRGTYTVTYKNNKNKGTATAIITANSTDSDLKGSVTKTFTIK